MINGASVIFTDNATNYHSIQLEKEEVSLGNKDKEVQIHQADKTHFLGIRVDVMHSYI